MEVGVCCLDADLWHSVATAGPGRVAATRLLLLLLPPLIGPAAGRPEQTDCLWLRVPKTIWNLPTGHVSYAPEPPPGIQSPPGGLSVSVEQALLATGNHAQCMHCQGGCQ